MIAGYRDRNGNEQDELSQTNLNVINGLKAKISELEAALAA